MWKRRDDTHQEKQVQGSAKRLRPGLENKRWKNCVLLPAAGSRTQFFLLLFTKPGRSLLAEPCISAVLEQGDSKGSIKQCIMSPPRPQIALLYSPSNRNSEKEPKSPMKATFYSYWKPSPDSNTTPLSQSDGNLNCTSTMRRWSQHGMAFIPTFAAP